MHKTKGNAALMNVGLHGLINARSIQRKTLFGAFSQPPYVLSMFKLNFSHFSTLCSYKKGSYKQKK